MGTRTNKGLKGSGDGDYMEDKSIFKFTSQKSSKIKYDVMNELQKYREIQRRTKLLYGVKDIKRLIEKREESKRFLQMDVLTKLQEKQTGGNPVVENKKDPVDEKSFKDLRDYFKPDNFIIPMNSHWKSAFDTFTLLVIGYSCLTTVFYVSFDIKPSRYLKIVDDYVTGVFLMDFIFNFFLEFLDRETF